MPKRPNIWVLKYLENSSTRDQDGTISHRSCFLHFAFLLFCQFTFFKIILQLLPFLIWTFIDDVRSSSWLLWGKYQLHFSISISKMSSTNKIKILAHFGLIFDFELNEKGHEPRQAENPLARAMAKASLARTHHYWIALQSKIKICTERKKNQFSTEMEWKWRFVAWKLG